MLPKAVPAWYQPPSIYDQSQLQHAFGGAEARMQALCTSKMPGSRVDDPKHPREPAKVDVHRPSNGGPNFG
jgi:hypothetical protein